MRNPKRIELILEEIKKAWQKNPDIRLCQLLSNVAREHCNWENDDLFHLDDYELFKGLADENLTLFNDDDINEEILRIFNKI